MKLKIDNDLCQGGDCTICVDICPQEIFEKGEDGYIIIGSEDECARCKTCIDNCPYSCLKFSLF